VIFGWFLGRKPKDARPPVVIDQAEPCDGVTVLLSEQEVAALIEREFHSSIVERFRSMGAVEALAAQRLGRDLSYSFRVRASATKTGGFMLAFYAEHPCRAAGALEGDSNE